MEGVALAVMLPLWSYKSELLTPNRKYTITFLAEDHHPRQGDKQKKTFCLACGSPLKPNLWRTAIQAEVWWCDINTEGVAPGYSW